MDNIGDFLLRFSGPTPYFLIFGILVICGLGLPIPEDLILLAAGVSAYFGQTDLVAIIAISYLGVMVGDSIIFWLGANYGRALTKKYWFFHKLLPDERLDAVRARLHEKGNNKLIFAARFMPGLRAPIFFSAGTLHLPYRVFVFYDGMAALLSVPAIIGAVYYFGDEFDKVVRVIKGVEHGIFFVIGLAVLAIVAKWYITHRKLKKNK